MRWLESCLCNFFCLLPGVFASCTGEVYASILKATGGVAEPRLALDPARYSTAEGSCGQLFGVLLVAIVTRGAIEGASGAIKGKRG